MTLPPVAPRHLKHYRHLTSLFLRHWDRTEAQIDGAEGGGEGRAESHSLADDLEALGPTYVKLGQLLRTRPDLLTPVAYEDLGRLHDDVESFAFDKVEDIVESELGGKIDRLFDTFDPQPLAAASLGQVHRATLRDGREVAVKVQRPGARERVTEDLAVLTEVTDFIAQHSNLESRYGLCSTLAAFRRTILDELDYEQEARNLRHMAEIMEPFDRVSVPGTVPDYCSGRVLTMDYLKGTNLGSVSPVALLGADREALSAELFTAYLHQALLHGFVHSDPHPGNVLLTPVRGVALVDLGQVTVVPDELRERLLRLLLAVADGDGSAAARIAERVGQPLSDYDSQAFRSELAQMVERERAKEMRDIRLGPILVKIARKAGEAGLRVPAELGLLGKTILNLEEVAQLLDPEFDPARVIKREAPELIARRLKDDLEPGAVFRRALQAKQFAEALPERLDRLLETAADGEFRIRMELDGEERIVTAMTRMANRLTSGIVLAALIVGASLLVRVETEFTVLGYPGFAVILFLLAALGGTHLLWRIWSTAEDHR